jgi:hypothetical protein
MIRLLAFFVSSTEVRADPKLPGDSGEVPISEWSGWRSDSCYEIFSLFDGKKTS